MVFITAIHLVGGHEHQHIAECLWLNPDNGKTGKTSTSGMVDYITVRGGHVQVGGTRGAEDVVVVNGPSLPYLRATADGLLTDNLLALPRY
jgi:hypothetical protein